MAFVSHAVVAQVVYGNDEKDYIRNNPKGYIFDVNDKRAAVDQQAVRYKLSGIGDNWFVSVQGGVSFFYGSPSGCGDVFDRTKPAFSVGIGKWHSPYFGTRLSYQGFQLKDANMSTTDYTSVHGDLMLNVASFFHRSQLAEGPSWNVSPYIGCGLLRNGNRGKSYFAFTYGVQLSHKVADRVSLVGEFGGQLAKKEFDGVGNGSSFSDGLYSFSIGLSLGIGRQGWNPKRKSVTDRYVYDGESFTEGNGFSGKRYQPNNYSGLNSLRERLAQMGNDAEGGDSVDAPFSTPVLFFFKINTTKLIDKQQLHNIDEIASAVNDYDLKVHIVGAADSHTGTKAINRNLAIRRCKYIAKLLMKAGVPKSKMTGSSLGGVDIYHPYPSNRHTCVIVYKNHYKGYGYGSSE